MIYFKACPRCKGDMVVDKDQHGHYMECLQCGYETDPPGTPKMVGVSDFIDEEVSVGAS